MEKEIKLNVKSNDEIEEEIFIRGAKNEEVLCVLRKMINNGCTISDVNLFNQLCMRGYNIKSLYYNCCGGNIDKFMRTLEMFRSGAYSPEEVQANLELENPFPFIDDEIMMFNVPEYGVHYGQEFENWGEYCIRNRKSFLQKMDLEVKKQRSR